MQSNRGSQSRDSVPQRDPAQLKGGRLGVVDISPFTDRCNAIIGVIAAIGTYVFGQHWWLFMAYFLLNLADEVTGCIKAMMSGTLSSVKGLRGLIKKVGYWVMIAVSFGLSAIFIEVGEIVGADLGFTIVLGWFVLVSLIINEARSILENFAEAGYEVPGFLTKGLEVVNNRLDALTGKLGEEETKAHDE